MGEPSDETPEPFRVFYVNMHIGSTYLLALITILVLVGLTVVLGIKLQKQQKMHAYLRFLYNFFVFGCVFAGCASFQGSIMNPTNTLSVNGLFYITGTLLFAVALCETLYRLYDNHVAYFWRLRVFLKAAILSLAHFSPVYLLTVAVLVDLILLGIEHRLCRYPQYFGKFWLFAHIAINFALIMLVFLPVIELALLTVSLVILMVLISEAIMHYR